MKIGIMGGTFDPVHNGHLMLGEYAYKLFELDEIWFLPNGNPPHKMGIAMKSKIEDRVTMILKAIEPYPYFKLSRHEISQEATFYSYSTMEYYLHEYPDHLFYFIVGADSLFSMEEWKCPERLFKACTILAAFRDDIDTVTEMNGKIDYLKKRYGAEIKLLATPLYPVSSKDIRQHIANKWDVTKELPAAVATYIKSKHLYEENNYESS